MRVDECQNSEFSGFKKVYNGRMVSNQILIIFSGKHMNVYGKWDKQINKLLLVQSRVCHKMNMSNLQNRLSVFRVFDFKISPGRL